MSRAALVLLVVSIAAVGFSACGSSTPPSSQAPTDSALLKPSEINKAPAGSAERAFMNYWSNLQYRSWGDVASFYDPKFREFIGTSKIIAAKKQVAASYPVLKPKIERINKQGENTTIYYTLELPEGAQELDSITWRQDSGNWQIIYDSRLDNELGQVASNQAEIKKTGGAPVSASTPPSPEAVRAGKAAENAQARFLQEELK